MITRILICLFLSLWGVRLPAAQLGPATWAPPGTLWQIGRPDDSPAEFADFGTAVQPAPTSVTVPTDWAVRTDWRLVPKGLKGSINPALEIHFSLPQTPRYGVMFSLKLLQAPKSGAQMAVFSNRIMAGLLQFWGTEGSTSPYHWQKTYSLYIPRELLAKGANTLRLETVRPLWSDAGADPQIWWEWDYLRLEQLAAPAREPVQGTVAYLGTTLKMGDDNFLVNGETVKLAPIALPWLGIAYSGNTMRADFWVDVTSQQPKRLEYLQALRDLNMTVCVDYISGSHFRNDPDGKMPARMHSQLADFFQRYGSLFQYYELGNEPCMFGGGFAEYLETARAVNQLKPAWVKTTAPGWAYGGGKGTPKNWDADPVNRRQVEALCDATNGHSYGYSYADNKGGSFVENLATYGGVEDGWPKEYVNTETGANNWHSEENGPRLPSTQPHVQAFDRILRAHLAVVDRTMQHAAIFADNSLFQSLKGAVGPEALAAYPGVGAESTRLATYRRLALAYATHGAPLPYVYLNRDAVAGKKVYFRAVDTAALPSLPGSGGSSDRILLNFVNFEPGPQTMHVRVTMPAAGKYSGERFGPQDTYAAAHSLVHLQASPTVDLEVPLAGGAAVQYILRSEKPRAPYSPTGVDVTAGKTEVVVRWAGSSGATSYRVLRATAQVDLSMPVDPATWIGPFKPVGQFKPIGGDQPALQFVDTDVRPGRDYFYTVTARNAAGISPLSEVSQILAGAPLLPAGVTATAGDGEVTLTWQADPSVTGYNLIRRCGPWKGLSFVSENLTPGRAVDSQVVNGQLYTYEIAGLNWFGVGPAVIISAVPVAPPRAPTALKATAGDGRVLLQWYGDPGAGGYDIERSTTPTGPYTAAAAAVPTLQFLDDGVANGSQYHYIVRAHGTAEPGPPSNAATAMPEARPLPEDWKQADIGAVGVAGRATVTGAGIMTVQGAGGDIWGPADALHYAYRSLHGDGTLTAHVLNFDDTNEWAKIGLMIRETTDPGSAMAIMAVTPGKGCGFTHRDQTGGACEMTGGEGQNWLRITRRGNLVTGYNSTDGVTWNEFAKAEIPMAADALIGLGVCSHNGGALNKAMFSDVTFVPGL